MTVNVSVVFSLPKQANTEILVGVQAELAEPKPENPGVGRLEFFVDWYVSIECSLITIQTVLFVRHGTFY